MGTAEAAQFGGAAQTRVSHKLTDIVFVRAGMRIGDVGEPFEF
jgi:hypothetical protein